jgi:hypothetical protein
VYLDVGYTLPPIGKTAELEISGAGPFSPDVVYSKQTFTHGLGSNACGTYSFGRVLSMIFVGFQCVLRQTGGKNGRGPSLEKFALFVKEPDSKG